MKLRINFLKYYIEISNKIIRALTLRVLFTDNYTDFFYGNFY
jgi:hypothetical protein